MISVIGAGPSGSYLAYLLAKKGEDVKIFEEHKLVGKPVQCTGIITSSVDKLIKIDKNILVNKFYCVRVHSPNGDYVDIKIKGDNIFDRAKFDEYLVEKALDAGAEIRLHEKYLDFKNNEVITSKSKFKTDFLVGADGPLSLVAKSNGLFNDKRFVTGLQARVKAKVSNEFYEVFLGKGYFGWSVPENEEITRLGIIANFNPKDLFYEYVKKFNGEILEYQSGIIPIYNPRVKTSKDNVFLVGDSAGFVKATTFGGILQGMMASEELCKSILEGKSYDKLWRKRIGSDMWMHLMLRKKLDKMDDSKYNELIKLVKKDKVREILNSVDRDFVSKMFIKLLLKEPRLLKFAI
ncbi:MAG: NAD(P)/FAD-dependent oxidoreductase [Nanoarchaeota archaeon]